MSADRAPRFRWIDVQDALGDVVESLVGVDRYALDTEFHRERTYFPRLALVQIAWIGDHGQEIVLIDPLTVDVSVLGKVFATEALCVIHAAQQDLDVLYHSVGSIPDRIFDTQIAGGFTGYGTPSLVSLLTGELGVTPAKGDRLTDWLRRPLSDAQRNYAAADVAYLLEVHDRQIAELGSRGRLDWVVQACEDLRLRPASGSVPEDAWLKLKDARSLRPRGRAVAQAVAGWREERAQRTDTPVRQVLPDLGVLGVAQRVPTNLKELGQARGIDDRHSRGRIGEEILEAVRLGRSAEPPVAPRSSEDLDRSLRPAVTLVSAWVSQMARDEEIDTALLATRSDIVALVRGDEDARLASGWRSALLGDAIRRLVGGQAALTFDSEGHLKLVELD